MSEIKVKIHLAILRRILNKFGKSVLDCCTFIYPRLTKGGFLIFDDYGFPTCTGARQAVDTYFADKQAVPLILSTGQAIVFKNN